MVKMFASHSCCGQIQVGLLLAETQSWLCYVAASVSAIVDW